MNGLTPFALVFMLVSMGTVTTLAGWCMYRILTGDAPGDDERAEPPPGPPAA